MHSNVIHLLFVRMFGFTRKKPFYPRREHDPRGHTAKVRMIKTQRRRFAALQKKIAQSGSAVAVAFIGYVDSESSEADLRAYVAGSETGKEYPSLSRAPLYIAEGQELYAIIPPNDKGTIIVYPSTMTEDGEYADDKSNPLHVGEPANRCCCGATSARYTPMC